MHPKPTTDTLLRLYSHMYRIRRFENMIAQHYPRGFMQCPVHLCIGQEAIPVAICDHLNCEDTMASNHRSHGHYLAKGGDMTRFLEELCGLSSGCSGGWGGSMHPYAPEIGLLGNSAIVGGGLAIATGMALATKLQNRSNIAVAFIGDGGTESGYFYESLNFAALHQLPILYVVENNGLATHSRIEQRRPANVAIHQIARSLGVTATLKDGNQLFPLWQHAGPIIDTIRSGGGPHLIEVDTYRWMGHVTPEEDVGEGYRDQNEIDQWKKRCPVEQARQILRAEGLESESRKIEHQIDRDVNHTFEHVLQDVTLKKSQFVPRTPF